MLSCGRVAYQGSASGIVGHFATLGTPFPEGVNIAEAALDMINMDFAADKAAVTRVLDVWAQQAQPPAVERLEIARAPPTAGFVGQLTILMRRSCKIAFHTPDLYVGRAATYGASGLPQGLQWLEPR